MHGMKNRVTITLDPAIHRAAKRTARSRSTTLSGLVETLLSAATEKSGVSVVDGMIGSSALRETSSDPLAEALRAKYLRP
jgi:hypothetical protein